MLLIIIPIFWISIVALVIAACRLAGRADATPNLAGGPQGRTVREGLVVWDTPETTPEPRRRRLRLHSRGTQARPGLTPHGLH